MTNAAHKVRKATLVAHWSKLFEDFQTPALEFYTAVNAAMHRRQIPEFTTSRVHWREGSLVSAKREYLRAERGNHVLDICAAPFGTGFFFSSWLCVNRPTITILHIVGLITSLAAIWISQALLTFARVRSAFYGRGAGSDVDPFSVFILTIILLAVLLIVFRTKQMGHRTMTEEFVLGLTIVGPFIDVLLRPRTHYEIDTGLMFQAATHAAMLEVIDQVTTMNGMRPLTDEERKPILRDLFKR